MSFQSVIALSYGICIPAGVQAIVRSHWHKIVEKWQEQTLLTVISQYRNVLGGCFFLTIAKLFY